MNEQDLRDGLRGAVADSSPPPPMNPNTALDAGRRAHRRRRARWAGAGAAVAVTALAAGAVLALNRPDPGGVLPVDMGSAPGGSANGPEGTKPSWPNGQQDRTATTGPQAQKGEDLLHALTAALPGTLTVDLAVKYPQSDDAVTGAQAQFLDKAGDKEIWDYMATAAVTTKTAPQAGTGRVIAEVYTPGKPGPADVCELAKTFWGVGGECTVKDVQGKQVGLVTKAKDPRIGQVAGYRYSDGTVVFVAQSKDPNNEGGIGRNVTGKDGAAPNGPGAPASMAELPLTVDQLAGLVLSPSFKLS
jgi:hypothetical protein